MQSKENGQTMRFNYEEGQCVIYKWFAIKGRGGAGGDGESVEAIAAPRMGLVCSQGVTLRCVPLDAKRQSFRDFGQGERESAEEVVERERRGDV